MNLTHELLDLALQLPSEERASLAQQLLLSLEPDSAETDGEELWQEEINARLTRVEKGDYAASEWREAVLRIRNSLAQGPAT